MAPQTDSQPDRCRLQAPDSDLAGCMSTTHVAILSGAMR